MGARFEHSQTDKKWKEKPNSLPIARANYYSWWVTNYPNIYFYWKTYSCINFFGKYFFFRKKNNKFFSGIFSKNFFWNFVTFYRRLLWFFFWKFWIFFVKILDFCEWKFHFYDNLGFRLKIWTFDLAPIGWNCVYFIWIFLFFQIIRTYSRII